MNKIKILIIVGMCTAAGAQARQLDFREAVDNARGDLRITRSADLQLLYTYADNGANVAYFAGAPASEGFTVIAADDVLPAVLGYSDSDLFDPANIPPAMVGWLKNYGDQLNYMVANGMRAVAPKALPAHAAIAPLCTSRWSQSAPYNNDCPTISSKTAPTGCTATAVAQAMYAHKWPVKGTGTNTYTPPNLRSPLTFDFGSTTFDWANMLDSYSGSYTDTQAQAVAVLMAACGNAALMQYGSSSSGAYPYDALYGLVNFLNYDKGGLYVERDYYTATEWDEMVYNELSNKRPVVYGGYNYDGGHTFVVDGYNGSGYYHLNWGWGGLSNGYFLLTALDPSDQGIGGTASGYNFGQDAIMNLKPAEDNSAYAMYIYQYGNFATSSIYAPSIGSIEFKVDGPTSEEEGYFKSFTLTTKTVTMGVKLTPEAGGESTFYPATESVTFDPYYGSDSFPALTGYKVKVSTLPKEGVFIATPAYSDNGEVKDVKVKIGCSGKVRLTCSKSGVNMQNIAVDRKLVAVDVAPETTLYSGKSARIKATFKNSGEEYLGLVYPVLLTKQGAYVGWLQGANINVQDNESLTMSFTGIFYDSYTPVGAGDYLLDIVDETGNYLCESPVPVTMLKNPGKAVIESSVTSKLEGEGTYAKPYLTGDAFPLDLTVKVSSGVFDDKVTFYGYYVNGKDLDSSVSASVSFFAEAGSSETKSVVIPVSEVPIDELAYIHAYGWDFSGTSESVGWFGKDIYFKRVTTAINEVSEGVSGIYPNPAHETVHIAAKAAISGVTVYSLAGTQVMKVAADGINNAFDMNVSSLSAAPYIVVVTTASGVETHKLIKK